REPRITPGELRERVSLTELIGEYVELKRQGAEHVGLCPFHQERTPSFTVNEEKGLYLCRGCGKGGDCFDFLQEHFGLNFIQAADHLKGRLGIASRAELPPIKRKPLPQLNEDEKERKQSQLMWCVGQWAECTAAGGTAAEAYLLGRGINSDLFGGIPYDI